jgi:hypothetical protein
MFAGDGERERAAAKLKEQYVRGRLTLDELSTRTERVLTATTRSDLRAALSGLPVLPDVQQLASYAVRGLTLAIFTGAYVIFSFALLVILGLTALIHGASGTTLAGFLLVWLVPTWLLSRLWRGKR